MKRDDDFLRRILLDCETSEDCFVVVRRSKNQSQEDLKFSYHIDLLCDAGLMTLVSSSGYRMTNSGHDYLDAIRSETVWLKTKKGAAEVGGLTLGLMKDLALALVKQEAAEKLGIKL